MMKIAFPGTEAGLDSEIVAHFGHTAAFVTVEIADDGKTIGKVELVTNPPHGQGGCMMPVNILKNAGVTHVVLGGIGQRPLMGFVQVGIEPYRGVQGTIRENLNYFLENRLQKMIESNCATSRNRDMK